MVRRRRCCGRCWSGPLPCARRLRWRRVAAALAVAVIASGGAVAVSRVVDPAAPRPVASALPWVEMAHGRDPLTGAAATVRYLARPWGIQMQVQVQPALPRDPVRAAGRRPWRARRGGRLGPWPRATWMRGTRRQRRSASPVCAGSSWPARPGRPWSACPCADIPAGGSRGLRTARVTPYPEARPRRESAEQAIDGERSHGRVRAEDVGYVQQMRSFFSTGGMSCVIDGLSRLAWPESP